MTASALRHPPSAIEMQQPLPLEGAAEDALRAAYAGSGLEHHGVTFEVALRDNKFAIPLRRTAEHLLRNANGQD